MIVALVCAAPSDKPIIAAGVVLIVPVVTAAPDRFEQAIEGLICDCLTLLDAFSLVERPVHAEINAALAVLLHVWLKLSNERGLSGRVEPSTSLFTPLYSSETNVNEMSSRPKKLISV